MPFDKLFSHIDLESIIEGDGFDLSDSFGFGLARYAFSVVWTRSLDFSSVVLEYLAGQKPPSTKWHNIITKPISDDDGEISVSIGHFYTGSDLSLSFRITSTGSIPRVAILVTNIDTHTVLKVPIDSYKPVSLGQPWEDRITITLP